MNKDFQSQLDNFKKGKNGILNLSGLKLREIPREVFQLSNILVLDLSDNLIHDIPYQVFQIRTLRRLNLRDNFISDFGTGWINLVDIEVIDISRNYIREIPQEVTGLSNLQLLNTDRNPIILPPPEIAFAGIDSIRNFFSSMEDEEQDYLHEVKLLLVGEGRVGKTSISNSLVHINTELEHGQSTEGIDIKKWVIPSKEFGDEIQRDFKVNIWDFGGQEIYHSTHQFFLTERSIYLFVTESRREDKHDDFYYWFNIIGLLGGASPIILCQNKVDQPTKHLPVAEFQKSFKNLKFFQRVSCMPSHKSTIKELKSSIISLIQNTDLLPHIGSPLPKTWVSIRNDVEESKDSGLNYISESTYLAICSNYGLDEEKALWISRFFHDLGVFLHFQDDLDLRGIIFLNFEWVTNAVYRVLDSQGIIDNQGRFRVKDLENIWGETWKSRTRELISLMKKFELCFQIQNNEFLAPQLLPVDEIHYKWDDKKVQLQFQYQYKFMPKGILSRFIVKRNKDILDKYYWRFGTILEYEETKALIKENYFEKSISLKIEGKNKKALLGIIRKSFQEIHEDFKSLSFEEMIPCLCNECSGSEEPHFFKYESLKRRVERDKEFIECENSFLQVPIKSLMDGIDPGSKNSIALIRKLVEGDRLEEAIELTEVAKQTNIDISLSNEMSILKTRLNRNNTEYRKNIIYKNQHDLVRNSIASELLKLLE